MMVPVLMLTWLICPRTSWNWISILNRRRIRLERRLLPEDINYDHIQGLRLEAREKLSAIRPRSLGQAGRISGVSPADMAALMIYLGK